MSVSPTPPREPEVSITSPSFPGLPPHAESGAWTYGLVVVLAGVLMAGGEVVWGRGILLVLIGVAVLMRPPQRLPGHWAGLALGGFLLTLATGFLPMGDSLSGLWRGEALARGIALPDTLSVHPWRTLETWLIAFAAVVWLVWLCDLPPSRANRQQAGVGLAIGVSALAVAVILGQFEETKYPLAPDTRIFSFFPNKNQMALILCLGGIFGGAVALTSGLRRPLGALAGLAAVVLCFAGIGFCDSRAAQFLLILALLALTFLTSLRDRRADTLKSALPVLLIALVAALVAGSGRLRETLFGDLGREDMRYALWQDVMTLFSEQPVFGVGLGTFRHVFWQYRDISANTAEALHPDSDVFWLLAETGLVGVIALGFLVFCLLRQLFPMQPGRTGRFRTAAVIAALAFLLHGIVDVGGHRLGTALAGIFVFALGRRSAGFRSGAVLPGFLARGAGVVVLLVGLGWTLAGLLQVPLESSVAVANAREAYAEVPATATDEAEWLVAIQPMDWAHYMMAGRAAVLADGDDIQNLKHAQERFRQARFLQPVLAEPAIQEARVWENTAPNLALNAWREALSRVSADTAQREFLHAFSRNPDWQEHLGGFMTAFPSLRLPILLRMEQPAFGRELERYLQLQPDFAGADRHMVGRLFEKALAEGESERLLAHFATLTPEVLVQLWEVRARLLASGGDFHGAVRLVLDSVPTPEFPTAERRGTLAQLFGSFRSRPGDVVLGLVLLRELVEAQDFARAQIVAGLLADQPNSPPAADYWLGVLRAEEQPKAAWTALVRYLQRSGA